MKISSPATIRENRCSMWTAALLLCSLIMAGCASGGGESSNEDELVQGASGGSLPTGSSGESGAGTQSPGTGTENGIAGTETAGSDEDGGQSGENSSSGQSPLRVTTFNAGLLRGVIPLTDERVGPIGQALAEHDSDVICLQEVWEEPMAEAISGAAAAAYPHSYRPAARQKYASKAPVCEQNDFNPTLWCLTSHCLNTNTALLACAAAQCAAEVADLAARNPECAAALFAQAGKTLYDLTDVVNDLFNPSARAGLFAFEGSSGLLLLSRYPLQNAQTLDFYEATTTSRRAAIFAEVDANAGSHYVGCTHLSSDLDGLVAYTGPFSSWEEENAYQADQMIAFARRFSGAGGQYLAGDFNCSIASSQTGAAGDFQGTCRKFLSAGYDDLAARTLKCTYCTSNLLATAGADLLLDHVFTKDASGSGAAQRVLAQTVRISGRSTNLSDHYGLQVVK